MPDNVENKLASQSVEEQIGQKAAAQTAEELKKELVDLKDKAGGLKTLMESTYNKTGNNQLDFTGNKEEKDTQKGKADSIKEFIQKMLFNANNAPEKVPAVDKVQPADPKAPVPTPESTKLLKKLSKNIKLDQVNEHNAPYLYDLVTSIVNGKVKTVPDVLQEVKKAKPLQLFSPGMFDNLQKVALDYAVENNMAEKDARQAIEIEDSGPNSTNVNQDTREGRSDAVFEQQNWPTFTSYFNEGKDKEMIKALYSPEKFISYYTDLKEKIIKNENSPLRGKDINDDSVGEAASKQMEVNISLLFAKLYAKLDHEKPQEFFQTIEQEDMLRGIVPVKAELKRRIQRLSQDLQVYEQSDEYKKKYEGKKVVFFRRLEEDTETVAINVGDEKKPNFKPQPRLKTTLIPTASDSSKFTHYLEQLVDHYIEARRYTHNSRAIFLHPPDPQKGFYGQLASFAAEMTTLDFDQMMLLPDNDIFQSAFGLYNKMIEEGFAKNDWRHPASSMFTPKENENTTQIEQKVLKQLEMMYGHDVSEERLTAALTMAVGASRGMFLTEVEMAAHADPHLDEKGKATFTSYYNQDASALTAFNPQHSLYRFFGGPNLLDPIFFLPVESFKGSQSFSDHNNLWEKAKLYKESFLKGRESLKGETTFFDMLDNIGLVGGPMQRKGWRTSWQLKSMNVLDKDPAGAAVINHVKTFKYFENIGYELVQDYVTKLDDDFAEIRDMPGLKGRKKDLVAQKKELFKYIFEKYFDKDPKNLGTYLDSIRKEERNKLIQKIKSNGAAPSDIDAAVEGAVSKAFLDKAITRLLLQRVPSKILRMDRDRMSEKGTSRYKQVMKDMGLDGQYDSFDAIMQDMILVEQLLRKEVSGKMNIMRDKGEEKEKYGDIEYRLTREKISSLLAGKQGMTQERLNKVLNLYDQIQKNYMGDAFIDKELVPYFRNGGAIDRKSKYTIALDETDLSFIPFRGGGQSVLARSIRDIASVEENVSKPIGELVGKLRDMAINGKKDFGPIIEIIFKVNRALDGIIGIPYANELSSKLAQMTIMYMKKDTQARALMGVLGTGRFNSMAAESAGKKVGVWEWDSSEIDRFIFALESRGIVPGTPYSMGADATAREPIYVPLPFLKEPLKLPQNVAELFGIKNKDMKILGKKLSDMNLFSRRKHDFTAWTSRHLREKFGGTKADMVFDILNRYLPAVLIFILLAQLKKAFDEFEGKKK